MQNEHENPQSPCQGQPAMPQPGSRPSQERPMKPGEKSRSPNERPQGDDRGREHGRAGGDDDKVGQDTDGDGKVVQPGQKPGQSGGKDLPGNER